MAEAEQRNKKGTVKEYENDDKLGVGIGGNLVMRTVKFCVCFFADLVLVTAFL